MKTIAIVAIFAIAVLVFFSDVILGPRILLTANPALYQPWRAYAAADALHGKTYRTDSILTYLPRQTELSRAIGAGRIPLWNPYILGGAPFFADPQSRVLYPVTLALVPVGAEKAMGYDIALHFFLALAGMYLFLRIISTSTLGSILGAFAYGFSSFFFTRMGHPTFVASAAWIPFFFYGLERARRSERSGTIMLAAFLVAGYLAGFPQVLVFGVMSLVVYAVWLGIDRTVRGVPGARAEGLADARALGLAGLISILVVGVHLVPFWEYLRNSIGLGIGLDQMRELYVSKPIMLLRCLFPGFFGNPIEGTNWVPLIQHGVHPYNLGFIVYCGIGTLAVALAAVAFIRQSEHLRALFALLVLSVGIGTSAVLLKAVYAAVPLFRYSQIDRISVVACFAVAALGGKGFSLWTRSSDRAARRAFLAVAGAVFGAVVAAWVVFAIRGDTIVSSLVERARASTGPTWPAIGAERIREWLAGGGAPWLAYENRQIAQGLAFGLAGLGLLLVASLRSERRRRLVAVARLLFVVCVALDVGLAAKQYYVSQPAASVFETDGIKVLRQVAGTHGEWRTLSQESGTWVLPANTNQLFGIQSLEGRSTIMPRAYGKFLAARGDPAGTLGLAGFMSGAYLLDSHFNPDLAASPVFEAIAEGSGTLAAFRMVKLGDDARPAFCLGAGQTVTANLYIPQAERCDFFIGFESAASKGGASSPDSLGFALTFEGASGKAQFTKWCKPGRWYEASLDLRALGAGSGRLTLAATSPESSGSRPGPTLAAWGGFEFVVSDCVPSRVEAGYAIDTRIGAGGENDTGGEVGAGAGGVLSLSVTSKARDLPLEIANGSRKSLRRVSFPSYLRMRRVLVDLGGEPPGRVTVTSDSSFTAVAGRMIYLPQPRRLEFELIFDGDMRIYENTAALSKALLVERSRIGIRGAAASRVVEIAGRLGDIPEMLCGASRITSYEPEKVQLEVSADEDGLLLFEDAYYPGWKAYVDGKAVSLLETDVGTRAIEIPRGAHKVTMTFKPRSLFFGLGLTCLGLLVGILYAAKAKFRAKV